jgi:hypothetical protein
MCTTGVGVSVGVGVWVGVGVTVGVGVLVGVRVGRGVRVAVGSGVGVRVGGRDTRVGSGVNPRADRSHTKSSLSEGSSIVEKA